MEKSCQGTPLPQTEKMIQEQDVKKKDVMIKKWYNGREVIYRPYKQN
jgi:hypothetical protein